jgi:predicted transcriptional regulator
VKSVRLESDLETRLERAAQMEGVSESEFMRRAIAERVDLRLSDTLENRLEGILGTINSNRGHAAHAHERYRELLRERREKVKKSRR